MATATFPERLQQEACARLELGSAGGRGWQKGLEPGRIPLDKGGGISYAALTAGKLRGGVCHNFALRLHSSLSGSAVDYTFRSSHEVGGEGGGVSRPAQLPELGLQTTTFRLELWLKAVTPP